MTSGAAPGCLVTGGAGFVGSHACRALTGHRVLAPRSAELDLLDFEAVSRYLEVNPVHAIIHAAGFVGGIAFNAAHPGQMAARNLRMGLNVLEAAARAGGVRVSIVSTVCVYAANAPVPTPETCVFDGYPAQETAFYGLAKRSLLTVAEGLAREFGLHYSYVIPTNIYGPCDHFEEERSHVVPALIRRALEAREAGRRELVVWGDGTQTRDLLYVTDAADGIVRSLADAARSQVLNLGSGVETRIRDLAEMVCEVVGFDGKIVWDASRPGGAPRRALATQRARDVLGFRPAVSLKDGIAATYDWYRRARGRT